MKGFFISVEGNDGSGKSTQIKKIQEYLIEKDVDLVLTREPGGTKVSEDIRQILLDIQNKSMDTMTEMFLYTAARRQHIVEYILPQLEQGKTVITDRFTDSSIAYQGYGRQLGEVVEQVNKLATQGLEPHITIYLELPIEAGIARKQVEKNHTMDRMELEKETFHNRVRQGYEKVWRANPQRIQKIDASGSVEEVFVQIKGILDQLFSF